MISLAAALVGVTPHAASAESPPGVAAVCTARTGVYHYDSPGGVYQRVWTRDSVCPNAYNAPIYAWTDHSVLIADMNSTNSWFLCWQYGAYHSGGNNIWYYTQGDDVISHPEYHAWGFMPANYVYTTVDPQDSRLPRCPW
jgi:hypothetical protein